MLSNVCEVVALILVGLGCFVFFTSVLGLFRFDYVLNRMHAAALCDALGVFLVLLGLILLRGFSMVSVKLLLILIFLWLTSPIASHLIADMELRSNPSVRKECEVEKR